MGNGVGFAVGRRVGLEVGARLGFRELTTAATLAPSTVAPVLVETAEVKDGDAILFCTTDANAAGEDELVSDRGATMVKDTSQL